MIGPVYFVTDATAPLPVADQARAAARAGVRCIQLRDKRASAAGLTRQAHALKAMLAPFGARLIINDRVDVACAVQADGVHVGQGDGDVRAIRARIGADMTLGLSVEHLDQLQGIPSGMVDYLGVGPVRATATKPDAAAPLGVDGLARIVAATDLPAVAIGGLGPGDAAALKKTRVLGMAVVSAIARAADPEAAASRLIREWRDA